ncbi:phosphatase PAP2 family protein [Pseudonocardia sp. ICBG1293]|uniref:phosphatase PAP2 family protein n=1 Tax=Pseudonocardia sp. ICBG1293 TaxID=2844382 RepID=UPI001CCF5517|nr:phosphatase PAP2 family protein [Pseudonocardia sp. ICBG1293]
MRPTPDDPSLLGPLQRPAPLIVAAAVAVVVVLAGIHRGDAAAGRLDRGADAVLDALGRGPGTLLTHAVPFGSPPVVVLSALLLAGAALVLRRPRLAALAVVGPGLTGVTTTVLKPLVGRTIATPTAAGYAFPSGHTGGAVSIGLLVALLLVGLLPVVRTGPAVAVLAATTLVAGGAVGAGMVRIGAHYPTDTVGGLCSALALGLGAATVIDRIADRRARPAPAA